MEFLGYGNQQPIWFQDILPSKGDEARQKQIGKAIVLFKISLLLRRICVKDAYICHFGCQSKLNTSNSLILEWGGDICFFEVLDKVIRL